LRDENFMKMWKWDRNSAHSPGVGTIFFSDGRIGDGR